VSLLESTLNSPDAADLAAPTPQDDARAAAKVFYALSPLQLRAAAHLYGIEARAVAKARILQIGCGAAENLIPFALAYPKAKVVGVDSVEDNVRLAQGRAATLGATNLELRSMDWTSIGPELGLFDYIIADDIYGRVPAQANQALLRICRENLAPEGIVHIGFRTYPGWKAAEILRDAMLMHSHGATTDAELIGSARAVLGLLAEGRAKDHPYGALMQEMVQRARDGADHDLVMDYLVGGNTACYYAEFADMAAQAGLVCIGDAEPQREVPAAFGNQVALQHSLIAFGKPKILRQQYLDFAVGRKQRRALLSHATRGAQCLIAPDLSRLRECRLAASLVRVQPSAKTPKNGRVYRICSGAKGGGTITDPVVGAVIETLSHAWPSSLTFGELVAHTPRALLGAANMVEHEKAVEKGLEWLFHKGALRYTIEPGPHDGEKAASGLRLLANVKETIARNGLSGAVLKAYNLWQESVDLPLGPSDRFLLPLIAEDKQFNQLVDVLFQAFEDGTVKMVRDRAEMEEEDLRAHAVATVAILLDQLKSLGLLYGSHADWSAYLSASLAGSRANGNHWHWQLDGLVLHTLLSGGNRAGAVKGLSKGKAVRPADSVQSQKEFLEFRRLYEESRWSEAEEVGAACVARFPNHAKSWHMYGDVLRRCGKLKEAQSALLKALAFAPLDAMGHSALGLALHSSRLNELSEAAYKRALLIDPDLYAAHANMAIMLKDSGRFTEAEAHSRRAIEIKPKSYEAYTNLANILTDSGRQREALEQQKLALTMQPGHLPSYSNMLFTMAHTEDVTPEELYEAHVAFGTLVAKRAAGSEAVPPHENDRDPDRKLRVGFVSADLRNHAVANFLEPVWAAFDRNILDIYAYSNHARVDHATERLRALTQCWRTVVGMTDAELVRQIRDDRIDVLFDLSGHTAENRLGAFALRAGPVQVSWIGYPATTGMDSMDYYFMDEHVAPPGYLDGQFVEKLVYVPTVGTFKPFSGSADVNPLPALKNGYFTFGSFNRPSKISEFTMDLWARVLHSVPSARMLLGAMVSQANEDMVVERFAERGIERDRLIFRRRSSMADYMKFHHDVDAMLDTFPYTGGTTTNHALWMGVPVLTIRGKTRVSCQTTGVLGRAGLKDWVTESPDDFVRQAVAWTEKLPELAQLRAGLREQLLNAPGRDPDSVARGLEAAIRQMWRRWCAGLPPESFKVQP
jgi:predicted O-linked N-acetylglucosamine transferase (SPINDLY family)